MEKDIAVLIPALNEARTIAKVIRDFHKELPKAKIYVFDNGSTDKTREIALDEGALVSIVKRRGKGAVLKEMFFTVNADYYIIADCVSGAGNNAVFYAAVADFQPDQRGSI